jgi:hypothetical protein
MSQTSIVSMRTNTSFLDGLLKGEGEIANSSPSGPVSADTSQDGRYRLMRFGLTGSQSLFRYGVNYRTAGQGFANQSDQTSREIWGEWGLGMVRFKTMVGENWTNLERDPGRPRLTGTRQTASLALAPPSWPEFNLSYARSSSASSFEPTGVAPQRTITDTLEAAVAYVKQRWKARLFTAYSFNNDLLQNNGDSIAMTHGFSTSYLATDHVTIAPSFSFKEDDQRWSGVRLITPSASLALTYAPNKTLDLRAFGSFSRTRSSDGLIDTSNSKLTSALTWMYIETRRLRSTLSIDASYTASQDLIQSRSLEDVVGLLRLQFAKL